MVLHVLPNEFIEVFADNEAFVSDSVDNAWHQNDVVLSASSVFGVEYDFYYFF